MVTLPHHQVLLNESGSLLMEEDRAPVLITIFDQLCPRVLMSLRYRLRGCPEADATAATVYCHAGVQSMSHGPHSASRLLVSSAPTCARARLCTKKATLMGVENESPCKIPPMRVNRSSGPRGLKSEAAGDVLGAEQMTPSSSNGGMRCCGQHLCTVQPQRCEEQSQCLSLSEGLHQEEATLL